MSPTSRVSVLLRLISHHKWMSYRRCDQTCSTGLHLAIDECIADHLLQPPCFLSCQFWKVYTKSESQLTVQDFSVTPRLHYTNNLRLVKLHHNFQFFPFISDALSICVQTLNAIYFLNIHSKTPLVIYTVVSWGFINISLFHNCIIPITPNSESVYISGTGTLTDIRWEYIPILITDCGRFFLITWAATQRFFLILTVALKAVCIVIFHFISTTVPETSSSFPS